LTRKASPAAASEPSPTRVEIAAGGHQVVVESTDPLTVVACKALELWEATDSPAGVHAQSAVGFQAEIAGGPIPPDLTLPDRLIPGGDDDRRSR
jgi:hypothetical protein